MKYLIVTAVFIFGLALGYLAGTRDFFSTEVKKEIVSNKDISEDVDANKNEKSKKTKDSKSDDENLNINESEDTLFENSEVDSTLIDENISTEKLIKSTNIPIVFLGEELAERDTTIQNLLGIEDVENENLYVEFWESPLNYEGYKLSRKKLIVYGLSSQFDYKIYKDGSDYFFAYQNIYYKMKETQDFLPLTQVSKSEVFND